ncbi:O-methyltransferase-domain-containing protein [Macrophomina phaseolina]|uniref:O-methyltransferase-domain-containing protein n=1 Tax=Macrophomina phaseolina TaxID=35725 RepID=A0ABQ8G8D9_9PEZI|nr:O-methyltransferase-domain-containing protein [Macrophomina phaseolina]
MRGRSGAGIVPKTFQVHLRSPLKMATSSESMVDTAKRILANAEAISKYLSETGHPAPSFSPYAPDTLLPADESNPEILALRTTLLDDTKMLYDLALGPKEVARWTAYGHNDVAALQYTVRYDIPKFVPLDPQGKEVPTISYEELADKAAAAGYPVDAINLKRMLRLCMLNRIFAEPTPGRVAHSASSAILARSEAAAAHVRTITGETFPAAPKIVDALEKWGARPEEPWQCGFCLAFDTGERSVFEYWSQEHPEKLDRLAIGMQDAATDAGWEPSHLRRGFNWAGLGRAKVVDVGGARGHVSIDLAREFTELEFVVQDLPAVVQQAKEELVPTLSSDLAQRVTYQGHDFMEPQDVMDADIYLLRHVLHDWSDKYAAKILQKIVPAMKPGARILLNDAVLPAAGELPGVDEHKVRRMDLQMMHSGNAREREQRDWEGVLARADPCLKLKNVIKPPGSTLSVMEVTLEA